MRKNLKVKKPSFKLKPMCATVLLAFSVSATANPNGGAVVNGSASFNTNGNTLTVTNTPSTIINWQGFSINSNEITHFAQQSASSAVLNRVITSNPSVILGTLSSNGRVFLVNPGGIVFGAGSTVDVAGMVATSLNLSDADFLAGRGNFTLTPGAQAVSNAGNITAQQGGEIYLIAPNVENSGVITAPNGEILLAAGHEVQLVNTLDPNLRVNITAPAGDATNVGQLVASAGRLGLFGTVVKNTGTVSADSATMQGGKIVFKASQRVELGGTVTATGVSGGSVSATAAHSADANTPGVVVQTGTIDAQGTSGAGGSVQVNADNVLSTAAINVNGTTAGGQIAVVATGDVVTTSGAIYSANGGTASGGDILVAAGANSYSSGSYLAQGATGGNIAMTASNLTLSAAKLDASGTNGGGVIHVGGVLHGAAGFAAQGIALNNAGNLTVTGTTKLIADALQNGNGGEIVLWSDGTTLSGGAISAHGGALSGNGGFVEVSGKQTLGYAGALDVSAPMGASGTLLLDPANIVIDSAAPQGGVLSGVVSATLIDPHPVASNKFGSYTYVLTNGNVVVAVPNDSLMAAAAGAVYLFDGSTGALISTLTGSYASDNVGIGGVTALTNGNFVVNSWLWHPSDLGAITWVSGTTGVNGAVSVSNSLLGSYSFDNLGAPSGVTGWDARNNISTTIGHGGVTALTNGNYVVSSPWAYNNGGMVTWGNGLGGTVGYANAGNSLVGTSIGDFVGTNVIALSNGNYVVGSSNWKNGAGTAIGAVTWGNGLGGTVGAVSAANSLIGSTNYDTVGASITALSNGNYVVNSYGWNSKAGAVTWGNGAGGTVGAVSSLNSLVGTLGQNIGWGSGLNSTDGVIALVGNGNYVVNSSSANFVTWGNGLGGTVGNLSSVNSLQGTGGGYATKVTVLTTGNYVVANSFWTGAFSGMGSVTWGDGALGTVGVVSAANSLVGSILNDNVGSGGVTALTNGHYVVTSHNWDNGAVVNAGAVTWGNGLVGGTVGAVSSANSLVGSTANDMLGWNGFQSSVVALSNGNYVVGSKSWDNGAVVDAGAATWGNGSVGGPRLIGTITAANSLVGSSASDLVGANITALKVNGNYVVSSNWANGAVLAAGAATWGDGSTAGTRLIGAISAANSLVGTTASDGVGSKVEALANGNYVVLSSNWDNGAVINAGAATWEDGSTLGTHLVGSVSAANSLVGDTASDQIGGWYFTALSNGNFVVNTPGWHSNTGHVALGNGTTGLSGVASSTNGAVGAVAGDYLGYDYVGAGSAGGTGNGIRALPNGGYVISSINYNGGMSTGFGRVTLEAVPRSSLPFALDQGLTTNINPLDIAAKLNAGANVVLQANNDITQTVGSAITATGAGNLTLQAGRSILLNSSISIVGNLIVTANDSNAIPADRALGVAVLDASVGTLSAGAMTFTNSGGNISLNNITTTGTVVSNASGMTTLSGTNSMFMLDARTFSSAAGSGWVNIVGGSTTTTATSLLNINQLDMSAGALNIGMSANIGSLLNWSGGSITVNGSFGTGATTNITGTVTLAGTASGISTWNNPGTININGAGVLQLDGTNPLTLANYGAGVINLNGTAATPITFLNNANNVVISEYNGGVINKNVGSATSQTINAGLNFMAAPISPAGGLNVNAGTLILGGATAGALSGTFNVASASTLDMGATAYTFAATSTLTGNGTFKASTGAANTITTSGIITPGGASGTGTLSIVGALVMNAGALLKLNINGAAAGQYDVLSVSGAATIASGALNVSGVAGFGSYTVLTAGTTLAGATFGTVALDTMTLTQDSITTPTNLALNISANKVAGFTYWDGGAGTMNWNDALNWSADKVPTAATGVYLGGIVGAIIAPTNISVLDFYQVNSTLSTTGNFTLQSANDINLNASTLNGTGGAFTLLANNSIFMSGSSSIVGSYDLNVVLNSDADASGAGSIMLTGSSILSKGGNITLGGGLAGNGTGWARGTITSSLAGIYLSGTTLDASRSYGAGSVALNGRGYDAVGSNFADGVRITNGSVIKTNAYWASGGITVNGVGGASSSNNNGVRIDAGSTLTAEQGGISVKGFGGLATGTSNMGVFISGVGSSIFSNSGVVNIEGAGGSVGTAGGSNRGVRVDLGAVVSTFSSAINIAGNAAYGGDGIQIIGDGINTTGMFSTAGVINLYGLSGEAVSSAHGVFISAAQAGVATAGNINISGTSIASGAGGLNRGVRIEAGAKVDTSSVGGFNAGSINILAQGGNRGDGFQLVTGSSLLTDTGGITIVAQSGVNQSGSTPMLGATISASTISSKGGNIFVDGRSNATFGSNNYGVMVTAASSISTQATGNVTLIGQGGNGTDAATTLNNGVGVNGNSTVSVVNGLLSMFGTAGTVTGSTNRGVEIHGATTLVHATGIGSIYLNGVIPGSSAGGFDSGVVVGLGADVATTSGYINITGSGVNGGSNNYGVRVEDDGSTITSTSGNITLTGSGSIVGTANYGVGITNANALAAGSMVSSGSGNLKIVSKAGDVLLSGASIGTGVIASPIGGSTTISSQRNIIVDSVLAFNTSPVTLRVDNTGTGVGSLSGARVLTAGTVNFYYNPTVFGVQDAVPAQISATTLNRWMLVNNATNLQAIGASPANLAGSYALGNNLSMTGVVGFTPIGSNATPFTGNFDGLNREISNLTINTPAVSQVGLFGVIGATGAVKNLGLTNVLISGDASVGALAGINYGSLFNTYVSGGTVTGGNGATGGLVGVNAGGNGTSAVGVTAGVAGSNASISNSYVEKVNVTVTVAANPAVGGMVGINRAGNGGNGGNGAISQLGAVGGAGGAASVTNSYVTGGTVSGMGAFATQYVGGLIGQNIGGNGGNGGTGNAVISAGGAGGAGGVASLSNSYSSSGAVSGSVGQSGGLMGRNLSGTAGALGGGLNGGALGALGVASATNLFWNTTSTLDSSVTGIGANTGTLTNVLGSIDAGMRSGFLGLDFTNTWWLSTPNNTLPMLRSEWNAEINNAHQLQLMNVDLWANYSLVRNLDFAAALTVGSGSIWTSSGLISTGDLATPFNGTFDGQGLTITNLKSDGLFGAIGLRGVVNKVSLVSATGGGAVAATNQGLIINNSVTNSTINRDTLAGGLVGTNSGKIVNSTVGNTTVQMASLLNTAGIRVGGLVGANDLNGIIINSIVSGGSVSGQQYIGGLVGRNFGLVANSYVTGNTVSQAFANGSFLGFGGVAGENNGTISNSYVSGGSVTGNSDAAGFVGSNSGRILNSYISSGAITGTGNGAPLVAWESGLTINSHYDVDAVLVNGAPMVMSGGLYATQFAEWKNTGTLNVANSTSLAKVGNVFSISTTQGMKDMVGFAADARYNFRLAVTLDMSSVADPTLANYSVPVLAGSFNGNGNTLNNLSITTPKVSEVGLFSHVLSYATIDTLLLGTPSVTGLWRVGALAGWNEGVIHNSGVANGIVSAGSTVGGLVGVNDGFIIQSYVSGGSVSATAAPGSGNLGGLVGVNNGSIISNSYVSNGTLNGAANISGVGGLVGLNYGNVSNASVNGLAMTSMTLANDVGGLVGRNAAGASLTYSYVAGTANVIGQNNVGGLVGNNIRGFSRGTTRIGIVDNNYFSGTSVTGQSYVGGLVGRDGYFTGDGTSIGVTNNYVSSGAVSGATFMGALVGNGLPKMATNNHYNVDGVTVNTKTLVTQGGLYSIQFNAWVLGAKTLNIANYSGSLAYDSVSGKYVISSVQGLKDILGFADTSVYAFALGSNLDLSTLPNYSVPLLAASFDGQGNALSGLNINLPTFDQVGLFGHVLSTGSVNNLGLITPSVIGGNTVGGLVALNEGTILNSYVQNGNISGTSDVGGLVGANSWYGAGSIMGAHVSGGAVTGVSGSIGGLVGDNALAITNSYVSDVAVSSSALLAAGTWFVMGGLAGRNTGTLSNTYVSGGSVSSSLTSASLNYGDIGGLVGHNSGTSISSSYASGVTVNGAFAAHVGGLVGLNNSLISNSYAANTVTANLNAAGLVGQNDYLGTITTAFWDSTLFTGLGVATNFGYVAPFSVQGLTTVQSKQLSSVASILTNVTSTTPVAGDIWRIADGLARPGLISLVKTVTVTANNDTKTYNGAAYTTGAGVTYPARTSSSLIYGTPSYGGSAIGAVNAGSYTITPGGLYSSQYDLIFANGTLVVNPATVVVSPLTVAANNASKTYGTALTFAGTEFTPIGLLNGDTITGVTLTSAGAVNTANAGSYSINVTPGSEVFGQGLASNYTLTYAPGTLTVNPASLTVSAIVQTKIYGDADPALTYASSGLLFSDTLTGSLGRVAGENVGNYAINQGSLDNPNYAITFTGNTLSVTPRSITIAAAITSKVYGDADPNLFTVGGSGLASWDTNGTVFTGSLAHTGGENIGTYTITQGSLLANANYNVAGFTSNNLLITPALLTVVANSQNKVLGTPDPLLTYMTYGLKVNPNLNINDAASTTLSGALDRDVGDTIGTYSINQGSLALLSSNYTMTYVAGTFRILAPTVVQEITQMTLQSAPAEDTAVTSQEQEKKESAELLAEASIVDDGGQPLAGSLPVCR